VPARWVQLPKRGDAASRLSYSRYSRLAETTAVPRGGHPTDFFAPGGRLQTRIEEQSRIPYNPDFQPDEGATAPDLSQYCEPDENSFKKYIASYARRVARDPRSRSPDRPDLPVKTVKVYGVVHLVLTPREMAEGVDAEDPTRFLPIYMGEFNAQGHLLDPGDPLLYWVVPIIRQRGPDGGYVIKDYLAVHAGDTPLAGRGDSQ
jgi:hypothetical protein